MSVLRPRGPLPARVYWTRRALMLGMVLAMVVGVSRVVGGSEEAPDLQARAVGAASAAPSATSSATPRARVERRERATRGGAQAGTKAGDAQGDRGRPGKPRKPKPPPLAQPSGPCADSDVVVTPRVDEAYAGGRVTITLELTTLVAAACTWEVSPDSVVLRLTSGEDRIWSSQECREAIPRITVVPRKAQAATVDVAWNSRRSDEDCSSSTDWALPGWYHAAAVVLGGENPADVQFELQAPRRPVVTRTPEPEQRPARTPRGQR